MKPKAKKYPVELTAAQRRREEQRRGKAPDLVTCYRLTGPTNWAKPAGVTIHGLVSIQGTRRGTHPAKTLFLS